MEEYFSLHDVEKAQEELRANQPEEFMNSIELELAKLKQKLSTAAEELRLMAKFQQIFQQIQQERKEIMLQLINQLIEMEKINDFHYQNMVNQLGHVPACGKSAILFHLATLKELVEKI